MLRFLMMIWALGAGATVLGQARLEFDVNDQNYEDEHFVFPLAEAGLLHVVKRPSSTRRLVGHWYFTRYDTALATVWNGIYEIDEALEYYQTYRNDEALYLLFRQPTVDLQTLYRFDLQTNVLTVHNINPLVALEVTSMVVSGTDVYLSGSFQMRTAIIHHNMDTRQTRALASIYNPFVGLSEIVPDPRTGGTHVLLTHYRRRRSWVTRKTFAPGGVLTSTLRLPTSRNLNLLSARSLPLPGGKDLVLGTFSERSLEFPQGFFLTSIDGAQVGDIDYQYFTEFENFFDHLKPTRRARVWRKIFRKRDRGKQYRVRYRFLLHPIRPVGDYFLVAAEAYYPQYRSEMYNGAFGPPLYSNYRVFDGYRFTHLMLCLIDGEGQVQWNHSVPLPSQVAYRLQPNVQVVADSPERVVVGYEYRDKVRGRLIEGGELAPEAFTMQQPLVDTNERVTDLEALELRAWYDDQFLSYGFQKLLSATAPRRLRDVFFVNRFSSRPPEEETELAP